ncbi:MAG: sulfatase [Opitutaceae bacterium]|nr:sulfatase [Opitutaceae bacterium]
MTTNLLLKPLKPALAATAAAVLPFVAGVATTAAATAAAVAAAVARPPNIVVLVADDLGVMDLGCYNPGTFYETPNLDRLARQGMRFTNGYAACPVCSPTRYSLMTGRHPVRAAATDWFGAARSSTFLPAEMNHHMPLEETTLADGLRAAGYQTFFVGKWHLGEEEKYWPEHRGFDTNIAGWSMGRPTSYFSPYKNPRLTDGPDGEYITARLAEESIKQLRAADKSRPFLLYHSFYQVHTPLQAPAALVEKYKQKARRLGIDDGKDFGPEEQVWPGKKPRETRIRQSHPVFAAMVECMDTAAGRILGELDALGLAENTLVIFISDNGGLSTAEGSPTSNMPFRGGKGWVYEGGIREPFFARWPGVVPAGTTSDTPVVSTDLLPTVFAAAGVPPPDDRPIDGCNLVPLLSRGEAPRRDALFWHYPHYSNQGGFPGSAVRMGDWKLIQRLETGRLHLYNLRNDPGERTDLAAAEPERAAQMKTRLHAWFRETGARFLRQKPGGPKPWHPDGDAPVATPAKTPARQMAYGMDFERLWSWDTLKPAEKKRLAEAAVRERRVQ